MGTASIVKQAARAAVRPWICNATVTVVHGGGAYDIQVDGHVDHNGNPVPIEGVRSLSRSVHYAGDRVKAIRKSPRKDKYSWAIFDVIGGSASRSSLVETIHWGQPRRDDTRQAYNPGSKAAPTGSTWQRDTSWQLGNGTTDRVKGPLVATDRTMVLQHSTGGAYRLAGYWLSSKSRRWRANVGAEEYALHNLAGTSGIVLYACVNDGAAKGLYSMSATSGAVRWAVTESDWNAYECADITFEDTAGLVAVRNRYTDYGTGSPMIVRAYQQDKGRLRYAFRIEDGEAPTATAYRADGTTHSTWTGSRSWKYVRPLFAGQGPRMASGGGCLWWAFEAATSDDGDPYEVLVWDVYLVRLKLSDWTTTLHRLNATAARLPDWGTTPVTYPWQAVGYAPLVWLDNKLHVCVKEDGSAPPPDMNIHWDYEVCRVDAYGAIARGTLARSFTEGIMAAYASLATNYLAVVDAPAGYIQWVSSGGTILDTTVGSGQTREGLYSSGSLLPEGLMMPDGDLYSLCGPGSGYTYPDPYTVSFGLSHDPHDGGAYDYTDLPGGRALEETVAGNPIALPTGIYYAAADQTIRRLV